jgi:hypothetical protein
VSYEQLAVSSQQKIKARGSWLNAQVKEVGNKKSRLKSHEVDGRG